MAKDNPQRIANEIADSLGENLHGPRKLVRNVVDHCGADFAGALLHDTEAVIAAGGMLTAAGDRLRTKGGVFFYLARGRMSDEDRHAIFPPTATRSRRNQAGSQGPAFAWADRLKVLPGLIDDKGEVYSVKITLIGRPGKAETQGDLVITTMSHSSGTPTFPRGVPQPPETPSLYTVYIGAKQWRQIEKVLDNAEDMLIIDGMCAFDPELQAIAVYATRVTSKETEARKREQSKTNGQATVKAVESQAAKIEAAMPDSVPENVAKKLRDLHAAADLYRQKIAVIESKPEGQKFGLEMTQKLLRDVVDKIAALEKQYA